MPIEPEWARWVLVAMCVAVIVLVTRWALKEDV